MEREGDGLTVETDAMNEELNSTLDLVLLRVAEDAAEGVRRVDQLGSGRVSSGEVRRGREGRDEGL